jgi:dienelactone hydrolase
MEGSMNTLLIHTQGVHTMKSKTLSNFVGICLFVSSLATPSPVRAWTSTPQEVTFINDQGITLIGWLFKPAGTGPFRAVVMLHGCAGAYSYGDPAKGVTKLYREWGDRLVNAGYIALLVDSFTPRRAPQNQCGGPITSEVQDRPYDAYAGLKYLASKSFVAAGKVGLLGWSQGGSSGMATMDVTKANPSYRFKAAAVFYPGCGLSNAFGGISRSTWKPYAPLVILIGSADRVVSLVTCQTRVTKAQALGATTTRITIFNNAQHKFDQATGITSTFTQYDVNAKVAADAQTMQLFALWLR